MKRIALFFCMLLLVEILSAQNYTLRGCLVDSLNKNKIFYATIGLLSPDSTEKMVANTYSDDKGNFTLSDLSAGQYILKANLVGYEMLSIPVTVEGEEKSVNLGNLFMKKTSNFLQEVNIKAERPVYMMDGEKTLYNVAEDPTIQQGTASDALQNAPGVEVDVDGNITLRGVSSVEIWLNNKPSNMNEEALKQFIQQMPAGTIEKIEVITNPSARYSAKGSGGIINIVTSSKIKKNSFISFGARGSSTPDVRPFLSYVYGNEKFSFSAYANFGFHIYKYNGESSTVMFSDNRDTASTLVSKEATHSRNYQGGLFLNASYTPDTANTFYFWCGAYPSSARYNASQRTQRFEYLYNPGDYSFLDTSSSRGANGGGYGGLWYEHKFNNKGHKIATSLNYSGYSTQVSLFNIRDFIDTNRLDRNKHNQRHNFNHNLNVDVDYSIPYHENGEIEMGLTGTYTFEHNSYFVDTLCFGTTDLYLQDAMRSTDALCHDGEFNAYVTLQHRFGGFTLKGGLRTEFEFYNMQYINAPQHDFKKIYPGLYPSLHLSYRTKSMHNFKLSYTRRVNNPSGNNLTTYRDYSEDSYSTGNPELLPAYTNAVEAGWTKFINKFGNIGLSAYFRNTKDEFSNLTDVIYDPFFGREVYFTKPLNSGKSLNTGAELNVMYRLKTFMNIRFYANTYYSKSSFLFREEEDPRVVENLGYSFRLNFWAKAWKFLEINASANYRSKSKSLFTTTLPNYSIDCGLRAEFWKRRVSVFVHVNDIFNWNRTQTNINNPYYIVSSSSQNNFFGRNIRAGIEFKFGKMELEGSQASNQGGGSQGM